MVAVAAIYFRTHITLCKVAIVHVGADQSSSDNDREPIIPSSFFEEDSRLAERFAERFRTQSKYEYHGIFYRIQ